MKSTKTILALTAALTLCACQNKKEAPDASQQEMPVAVATPVTLDSVVVHKTLPGQVEAQEDVQVTPQIDGVIVAKCFRDGDYVQRGQTLYRIESKRYEAQVAEARAQIAQARSQYDYYAAQVSAMRRALKEDAVARINVEQAEGNMRNAAAQIAAAQAELAAAQTQLSYCSVKAPVSGQTSAGVSNGTFAAAGQTELCRIVNNNNLKVVFSITEQQYAELLKEGFTPGSKNALFRNVPLDFGDIVTGTFTTDLYYTAPSVDPEVGAITLEGRINNAGGVLRNGMYVSVELPMSTTRNALAISDDAIGTDQLGKFVYVVNANNEVVYTPIETGQSYQDTLRVVTSGLKPTDRYVTQAMLKVRQGMKVKPRLTR